MFDAAGRVQSVTTPNQETVAYTYNGAGDLLTLTDGRGKVTTWTNDAQGRVVGRRYAGQTFDQVKYDYDAVGRVKWRRAYTTPTSYQQTTPTWDDNGNLTGIDFPTGTDV